MQTTYWVLEELDNSQTQGNSQMKHSQVPSTGILTSDKQPYSVSPTSSRTLTTTTAITADTTKNSDATHNPTVAMETDNKELLNHHNTAFPFLQSTPCLPIVTPMIYEHNKNTTISNISSSNIGNNSSYNNNSNNKSLLHNFAQRPSYHSKPKLLRHQSAKSMSPTLHKSPSISDSDLHPWLSQSHQDGIHQDGVDQKRAHLNGGFQTGSSSNHLRQSAAYSNLDNFDKQKESNLNVPKKDDEDDVSSDAIHGMVTKPIQLNVSLAKEQTKTNSRLFGIDNDSYTCDAIFQTRHMSTGSKGIIFGERSNKSVTFDKDMTDHSAT